MIPKDTRKRNHHLKSGLVGVPSARLVGSGDGLGRERSRKQWTACGLKVEKIIITLGPRLLIHTLDLHPWNRRQWNMLQPERPPVTPQRSATSRFELCVGPRV